MTLAAAPTLAPVCPKCQQPQPAGQFNTPDFVNCPSCRSWLQVLVYPALFRPLTGGAAGEQLGSEAESSCFFHPEKRAAVACDSCGRFLCALCDLELNARHLCPNCLESGKKKGKIVNLQRERVLYDRLALLLATLPLLVWPFTIVTAPIALFLVLRYWKAPLSLVRPSRFRFVLAGLFASLQILVWLAVAIFLIAG